MAAMEGFDPLEYIEQAFAETGKPAEIAGNEDHSLELPSIQEYLSQNGVPVKKGSRTSKENRRLSAPRPRRVRAQEKEEPVLDPELQELWNRLPKNLEFLAACFDDRVTSNYYQGEFKESREELIRRLVDPELSLEEVSRLLGVCPATVRRYTNREWLSHHRTQGGQRRFRLSDVVRFVEHHGHAPRD